MRIRIWLRRACFACAACLAVLALVSPVAVRAADEDSRPPIFNSTAFASAVQLTLNTDPPQVIPEIVRFDLPHGISRFAAGGSGRARASSLYPGLAASEGPNLIWNVICSRGFPCERFPEDFPPTWPFTADAEYPTQPDATASTSGEPAGGGPLSWTPNTVSAHAGTDFVSTTAIVSDLVFAPPGSDPADPAAALVRIGSLDATTRLSFASDGTALVARSIAKLSDVSLFGGVVGIESLVARSISTSDGKTGKSEPSLTLGGVTLNGVPAKLTGDGLVVGDQPVDQGLINSLATGITGLTEGRVRLVQDVDATRGSTTQGNVLGVGVDFAIKGSGLPGGSSLVGNLALGSVSTSAFASAEQLDDLVEDSGFEFDTGFGDVDGDGGSLGESGSDAAFVAGEPAAAPDSTAADPSSRLVTPVAARPRFFPLEALSGMAARRLELLYGAWTLAMLGLALGSRLRPFRLARRI